MSNQKFGDFVAAYGADRVGLLTGDNTINGEAPIVVMTTEVLRNMLYERSDTLTGLQTVVMDEVHYLQDPYRGAVWEEVLIHLPASVVVVCLSATISNAEEFGDWIGTLRGTTKVVIEETASRYRSNTTTSSATGCIRCTWSRTGCWWPTRTWSRWTARRCASARRVAATGAVVADARARAHSCRDARMSSTPSSTPACCRRSTSSSAGPAATRAFAGCRNPACA